MTPKVPSWMLHVVTVALVVIGCFPFSLARADSTTAVHVVVLGSSTAAGGGTSHPDSSWVGRYRAALQSINPDHQVTNLAIGGYTTWHVRENGTEPPPGRPAPDTAHNITQALELEPDAIIVNLPSNDVAFGYSNMEQIVNYDSLRSRAGAAGVFVWLTTSQPRNLNQEGRDSLVCLYLTTLATYGYSAIDFWTDIAESNGEIRDEYDSGDGIHLNDDAHRILFERVLEEKIHELHVLGVEPRLPSSGASLLPIHPQPARGPVRMSFTLDREMDVTLALYDVRGRRLTTLADGHRAAGSHGVAFDTSVLPSGVYFAVLHGANGARATRRLAVLR